MRGQAAIEFLMTYGWAILVLAIAIGAIALSGIFSPTTFGKEYCVSPPQLECVSTYAGPNSVAITVANNFGFDVLLTSVEGRIGSVDVEKRLGVKLDQGAKYRIVLDGQWPEGSFVPFTLRITYVPCAKEINPTCAELEGLKYTIEMKGRLFVNPAE